MNYIVYKTTNQINGKIYVGVHRTNPDIFDGYIGCGVTKKDLKKKQKGFPAAVHKYGYENFIRETLFVYPDSDEGMRAAYQKEAEIVDEAFVKSKNTYNLTTGGRFTTYQTLKKCISQYTLDGKFIRVWESIQAAETALNLSSISQCLCGKSKYCGQFQWRYYTNETDEIPPVSLKEKTVYQFDLSGNLLKVWKSKSEAAAIFENVASAQTAIGNVCTRKTRQAFGYFWSYKSKFEYTPYGVAVAAYNDDGIFLQSFTSIKEAASQYNIQTSSNIINCIKGYQKHCGGVRWRYFYGNTSPIKALR